MKGLLMRRKDVMALLGVSREALDKLVDAGRLRKQYVRFDEHGNGVGHPYFVRVDVEAVAREGGKS